MSFMDWLRKLGVFRSGSYKWSGDAKDRPIEAIDDDVMDSKKDLSFKVDLNKEKEE